MRFLFDFLFQIPEQLRRKEVFNRDTQSVAQLLYGGNGRAVIPAAHNVIHRGLRHTAHVAELIDGDITFLAQLKDSVAHSFTYVHGVSPFFRKNDTQNELKCLTLLS